MDESTQKPGIKFGSWALLSKQIIQKFWTFTLNLTEKFHLSQNGNGKHFCKSVWGWVFEVFLLIYAFATNTRTGQVNRLAFQSENFTGQFKAFGSQLYLYCSIIVHEEDWLQAMVSVCLLYKTSKLAGLPVVLCYRCHGQFSILYISKCNKTTTLKTKHSCKRSLYPGKIQGIPQIQRT